MNEEWRAIPGFEFYEVSSFGRVRSLRRLAIRFKKNKTSPYYVTVGGNIINGWIKRNWKGKHAPVCVNVSLRKNNIVSEFRIHRLVLLVFVGECPKGMEGCHNDGNPLNNRLDNLRWDTTIENTKDSIRHGTKTNPPIHYGVNHPQSKLTEENIKHIREAVKYKGLYKKLGFDYNVHPRTIARIRNGESYNGLR